MINITELWKAFLGLLIFLVEILAVRLLWTNEEEDQIPAYIDRFYAIYHRTMYPTVYRKEE